MAIELTVLYFASLGEKFGCDKEQLTLTSEACTVASLKSQLGERGETWKKLLQDKSTRCAVNQSIANDTQTLKSGDDVAFFPPVTGG